MAEIIQSTIRFPGSHAYCAALAAGKEPVEASLAAEALRARIEELDNEIRLIQFADEFYSSL